MTFLQRVDLGINLLRANAQRQSHNGILLIPDDDYLMFINYNDMMISICC